MRFWIWRNQNIQVIHALQCCECVNNWLMMSSSSSGSAVPNIFILFCNKNVQYFHCVKSVGIRSFSGHVFSRIQTEYGEIFLHSVRMRENTDQKNSEYQHFSSSDYIYLNPNLAEFSLICWFSLNNSEKVKTVTLVFCSLQ